MVLSFPGYLLDVAYTKWIVLSESVPRLASGFPETLRHFEIPMILSLARHIPIVVQCSQQPQHSCLRFLFLFWGWWVVRQPSGAETNTHPRLCNPFLYFLIDIREDANIYKEIVCKYFSNSICTVVGEWHHGYFCLGYFLSSTHFVLVTRLAQKVWRRCVLGFSARSLLSCRQLHWSPCEHWPFSFHW